MTTILNKIKITKTWNWLNHNHIKEKKTLHANATFHFQTSKSVYIHQLVNTGRLFRDCF